MPNLESPLPPCLPIILHHRPTSHRKIMRCVIFTLPSLICLLLESLSLTIVFFFLFWYSYSPLFHPQTTLHLPTFSIDSFLIFIQSFLSWNGLQISLLASFQAPASHFVRWFFSLSATSHDILLETFYFIFSLFTRSPPFSLFPFLLLFELMPKL